MYLFVNVSKRLYRTTSHLLSSSHILYLTVHLPLLPPTPPSLSQQSNPSIRKALMRVLPYLTFGNVGSMNVLLDYFKPSLDFDRYDAESSTEGTLYLDCFIAVASGIGVSVMCTCVDVMCVCNVGCDGRIR